MASSDDEVEVGPLSVSNYHFVVETDNRELTSFSVLPIQWNENERTGGSKDHIFLDGFADNGLQKVFKEVIAWKFDLTNMVPEISVLSKEKSWIKLQKPRKSFEEIVRTILVTVHCLSYAKKNPEATGKSVWDSLSRIFSLYEVRPSQNDLVDHMDLISEAVKRDDVLATSKFLSAFLEEKPRKKKLSDEVTQSTTMSGFIVDDIEDYIVDDAEEDDSTEEDELFDSVCAFCDNGGELLCCEGRCMRSFHATVEAGEESNCVSLGLTKEEVEAMQSFFCKNCEYKQHQCFACGKLGSSDKSSGAEVFPCASATCGHFYHPHCVSKLLFRDDEVAADLLQKSIMAGESFTCPLHKCYVCKQGENNADLNLQFAVCRRCPKAYHRKCLPWKISFEVKVEEGIIERAWEGLLPNHRILIYCLKHEIDDELGTPIRDHIVFPGVEEKNTVVERLRKNQTSAVSVGKQKVVLTKSSLTTKVSSKGKFPVKALNRVPSAVEQGETTKKSEREPAGSLRKVKPTNIFRKSLKANVPVEVDRFSLADTKKTSLGDRLYAYVTQESQQINLGKGNQGDSANNKMVTDKPARKKLNNELPSLDTEAERRLLSLMKNAASSVSVEDILKKHKIPSTHAYSSKSVIDKAITFGKVEGSVEAIRTALKKLEEDRSSIEDAKAVCPPEVLSQIFKWKNKLKVYLAPFLHGMRYTSYGRHFTKVDKLQEIVDKFHWYVQDGDMIVDFCCGANDFSCLMKKKLEETGKKCLYKNYDILQAKNDFNFERRDWMTIHPKELASGSKLIMGLNPPFGVKAALANKFINKALEFKPKLLILIVPPETERLDKKKPPYELVWEDDQFLSGKSFYLPGSVDENDKQMDQWNLMAPPLNVWSRSDWAAQHKAIAEKHGHLSTLQRIERNCKETPGLDDPMAEENGDTSMIMGHPLQKNEVEEWRQTAIEDHGVVSSTNICGKEAESSHVYRNNLSPNASRKRKRRKEIHQRQISEQSPSDKQSGGKHPSSEIYDRMPHLSPANAIDGSASLEGNISLSIDMSPHDRLGDEGIAQSIDKLSHDKFGNKASANITDGKSLSGHSSNSSKMPPYDEGCQGKAMPTHSPADMINVRLSSEGQSSKSKEMPSHNDGYQGKGVSHCSPASAVTVRSTLERQSSKSIDILSTDGFNDNVHQHFGDGMTDCSPINMIDGKSSAEVLSSKSIDIPRIDGFDDNVHQHFSDKEMPYCSPVNMIDGMASLEGQPFKSSGKPSHTGFRNSYQHSEPTLSASRMQFGTAYDRTKNSTAGGMGRYGVSNNEPCPGLTYGISCGFNFEGQHTCRIRNTGRHEYRPYTNLQRESDIRTQIRLYGQDFAASASRYGQMGLRPSSFYGTLGSAAEASHRMSTSTMDRYAPHLNELNPTRISTFRAEPSMQNRSGFYDPRAAGYDSGFATGLNHPFSPQGSGGWLDD